MKNTYNIVSLLSLLSLTSCFFIGMPDDSPEAFLYEAVTMTRTAFENSTKLIENQPIETTGKIYIKDQYLIINEPNKGFHIYDNSNPESPQKIRFLQVLGSTDISIKNNVIYTNNAVDLLTIVINDNFSSINITKRIRNIFPELTSPDGHYNNDSEIVVDWNIKTN